MQQRSKSLDETGSMGKSNEKMRQDQKGDKEVEEEKIIDSLTCPTQGTLGICMGARSNPNDQETQKPD